MRPHPNVIQIVGISLLPMAVVTEWMPDGTLKDYLASSNKLTAEQQYSLSFGIAEGLEHLHKNGIVHRYVTDCRFDKFFRDLCPRNIFMTPNMTPRIADFGIARSAARSGTRVTQLDGAAAAFLAPENFTEFKFTPKSDIWALALVFVEVYGKHVHEGKSSYQIMQEVSIFQKMHPIPENVPAEIQQVMKECWHFGPEKRPTVRKVVEMMYAFKHRASDVGLESSSETVSLQDQSVTIITEQ